MASSNANGVTSRDIIVIAAVAGGGYLLYKMAKDGGLVNITQPEPSQDWGNVQDIIDRINANDSALLQALQQMMGSGGGGGNTTIIVPDGGGSGDGDGGASLPTDDANKFLDDVNTALDTLGYSGFQAQWDAMNRQDHDQNVAESYQHQSTAALESFGQAGQDANTIGVKNDKGEGFYVTTEAGQLANLLKPSTWKDFADRWQNFGQAVGDWWDRVT